MDSFGSLQFSQETRQGVHRHSGNGLPVADEAFAIHLVQMHLDTGGIQQQNGTDIFEIPLVPESGTKIVIRQFLGLGIPKKAGVSAAGRREIQKFSYAKSPVESENQILSPLFHGEPFDGIDRLGRLHVKIAGLPHSAPEYPKSTGRVQRKAHSTAKPANLAARGKTLPKDSHKRQQKNRHANRREEQTHFHKLFNPIIVFNFIVSCFQIVVKRFLLRSKVFNQIR
ncbi:MAG: hypothetical protein IJX47_08970 [Clostridia bacterium]|nr:hypothetical protein [Clostridia bacterium]